MSIAKDIVQSFTIYYNILFIMWLEPINYSYW